ncbi:unnamed protein product [Linum tenue]|uniref:Serine carboxypeptidase-like 45 n=1 Tax=Linum tenue TaxID=586396 RepID=A0AAV0ITP4_9ROSI|nr:unnamed protein product [Linum tenue]
MTQQERWVVANAMISAVFFALSMATLTESTRQADKITTLPGQPAVRFNQYSGYITVDKMQGRALFYYFVEAETEPGSKPLVLWLNGGPGCSSVGAGAFCEHGPFKPSGDVLLQNNYSWNKGHYVPQLAQLIVKSKPPINLKGIAIGNPLLDFNTDFNSRAEYFWSHGLISDATLDIFNTVCNYSQIRRQLQRGFLTPECFRVNSHASLEIGKFVDAYDVTLDVCLSSIQSQSHVLERAAAAGVGEIDVCVEDETIRYLNRKDVQKAFHGRLVGVRTWSTCSDVVRYEMDNLEVPTTPILGQLLKSGLKVLVYSGDQDSVIPLIGTRKLVNGLAKEMGLNTTVPYSSWFQGRQVGGWTQVYGDALSFATIRGASHEAPFSQPERSLELFRAFLGGTPLPAHSTVAY